MTEKSYYVYILSNNTGTTIYTGVTNNLIRRVYEHKHHLIQESFTSKYDVTRLVYYEVCSEIESAIAREKQLKSWSRKKKNELIFRMNPRWEDLYQSILE